MHRVRALGLLLFFTSALLPACASRETVVVREARPAPPCRGGSWVAGHYGRHGAWHQGHWRCPNVVEVIEVD